jgi:hypothetical protein
LRRATLTVAFTDGQLHHFPRELALHAEPFVVQAAAGKQAGPLAERLGRLSDQCCRAGRKQRRGIELGNRGGQRQAKPQHDGTQRERAKRKSHVTPLSGHRPAHAAPRT